MSDPSRAEGSALPSPASFLAAAARGAEERTRPPRLLQHQRDEDEEEEVCTCGLQQRLQAPPAPPADGVDLNARWKKTETTNPGAGLIQLLSVRDVKKVVNAEKTTDFSSDWTKTHP